ncbi:MAG: sulfatase-like hydrolase/transferase [Puniceicoccaceae bacterium]
MRHYSSARTRVRNLFPVIPLIAVVLLQAQLSGKQPNILWLSCEDINAHISCFGDPHAITPNLDKLSTEGVRYMNTFTTAGVCAPCRSGIITGMYQTSLGTQHMRGRAQLPEHIRPFPAYLREAGYYCSNNSKEDYQFYTPEDAWDDSSGKGHWRNRPDKDQPFFAVFNFGGCHESGIASESKYKDVTKVLKPNQRQNADALSTFPPYYPDVPEARDDWKRNYELITAMDAWAGDMIAQLKEDGLYENTIIFYWSDHGVGLPRAKRWLYDSGTHVPLIVRIPESMRTKGQGKPGVKSYQLVSSIDFGPTVLNLAGLDVPDHMQGQPFLGKKLPSKRDYVYGARDRMDERYDIIRMVRDKQFKYIRNYEPLKTYYQYMNTPEKGRTMAALRQLHEAGKLPPEAEKFFNPTKDVEELYDTKKDPHELNNLAGDPAYKEILERMRSAHKQWVKDTRDTGLIPEPVLIEQEKVIGNRYEILRKGNADQISAELAEVAFLASEGEKALPELLKALSHKEPAIRYWGATGIGNIGMPAKQKSSKKIAGLLDDASPVVRVSAARALCRMGMPKKALPVLVDVLHGGEQWERLHAAIVLDQIDKMAIPVSKEMHKALKPRPDLFAKGKYTVRVINRALNQLEGTDRKVD